MPSTVLKMSELTCSATCQRVLRSARWSLFVVCLVTSGCRGWNWKGDGFRDEFSTWGERQRPGGDKGEMTGLSAKSQQIERNLGMR